MDLKSMSLQELQALAYQVVCRLKQEERNLNIIEQQIQTKLGEKNEENNPVVNAEPCVNSGNTPSDTESN